MTTELLKKADEHFLKYECQAANDVLRVAYEQSPEDTEVLWRFARANYELAEENPGNASFREAQFRKAFGLISKALEMKKGDENIHKWYAICLAGVDEFASTKEQIEHAFIIKEHITKSIELATTPDWLPYYVLGRWCLQVANVSWVERKIAQSLFTSPPESSYEEALKWFFKALEIEKTSCELLAAIGETYYAMRNWSESKVWYLKAMEQPSHCVNDDIQKQKASQQLNQLTGY